MLHSLLVSAVLMGLAGTPHCLAMCGAACGALTHRGRASWAFHLGRLISYAAAGAVAAASVGSLATLGLAVGALRPLWTLVHVAALLLGMVLLWQGRQPHWMARMGRARAPVQRGGDAVVVMPGQALLRASGTGLVWAAWPCGLLQSALLVAALANGPAQGAMVMVGFAVASGAGLFLGPALWWRLAGRNEVKLGAVSPTAAIRLAGAALLLASAWALGHGVWQRALAWCFS